MTERLSGIIKERPLVFDGATGSNLLKKSAGLPCPDLLNIYDEESVKSLHEAYLYAGSDVIETNSFSSNPLSFRNFGISENASEIAKKAAEIAKKAAETFSTAGKPRFAAGSVGPIFTKDGSLEQNKDLLSNAFNTQVSALLEGGAELLVFETFQDVTQAEAALSATIERTEELKKEIPVILSVSGKNGKTHTGTPFEKFREILSEFNLFAFGINCEDFATIYQDIEIIKKISNLPLIVMPNSGIPEKIGGNCYYKTTSKEFSEKMTEIIKEFDPEIIGGCCGTTPEYIKTLISSL